ncbi:hypothetical protein ASG17_08085 [Brevundimonas sp. Leaf363]|uniref:DUF6880 family protein n=1 Tax=Brevundimonas sp. Leaf363 TaxID=1736353 RepID=UPI0006F32E84|nr:DUF6880 family protein [Brevundimonas sp. Leaf363]KQS55990.1 hypothetical protein ASG17_08085 [Brevundimonas sp. Leaf363]
MAKKPTTAKKTVSAANLAALGAERLAALLMEAGNADPALKRRLRMELAAEVGAADLAFEIDKRLNTIGTSRARVSWRKRPALLTDLKTLLRIITDRLAAADARLGLDRLVAWFDLYPDLTTRVSDAKGELPRMFDDATTDLGAVATAAGPDVAAPVLVEALSTRLNPWASWVGRAAPSMEPDLARRVLAGVANGPKPTGRLALVVRKLADRGGDLDAWMHSIGEDEARKPDVGAEIARRLALGGRPAEARAALDAARHAGTPRSRWSKTAAPEPPSDAWTVAEIAVLDAEGRKDDAEQARWARFARTLSADDLKVLLSGLADFEDVAALDRAFEIAAHHHDAMAGLAFLIEWPAVREAAALVVARQGEIRGGHVDAPLWASRLAGRYPLAALVLIRARARSLVVLGAGLTDEARDALAEAEAFAASISDLDPLPSHDAFAAELAALAVEKRRRGW